MGDWRLRLSIHLTSATIRQCRVYTFTSFSRTEAGLFLHLFLAVKKAEAVGPSCFYVRRCDICYSTRNRYTTKLGGPAREQKYWFISCSVNDWRSVRCTPCSKSNPLLLLL